MQAIEFTIVALCVHFHYEGLLTLEHSYLVALCVHFHYEGLLTLEHSYLKQPVSVLLMPIAHFSIFIVLISLVNLLFNSRFARNFSEIAQTRP